MNRAPNKGGSERITRVDKEEYLRFLEETIKILIDITLHPQNPMAQAMLLARHAILRYRDENPHGEQTIPKNT